jgi:copper chaperone CopZ
MIALFSIGNVMAQSEKVKKEKAKFKVFGNCEMCEERIEKAVMDLDGVFSASWDKLSKKLNVKYDPAKVKLSDIHKAVAKVGHDTELEKADDQVYNKLHSCCKYEREKSE